MYKKVATDMNFVDREKEIVQFWRENQVFQKSVEQSKGKKAYTFYDGPPTANGKPHIGHILTRCIKDVIPRYRTMKGYDVLRKAGWDTHGLPVELEVEKQLGLDGKEQIETYGVEPFIAECKKSVWKYKGEWERMSERVGFWADMENPYVTYDDDYIESEWWALKKISDQGLLYKGHKTVPYCPRCGTALSSHEVAQGYKDVTDTTLTAAFRCLDEDAYYLAWTTTPWTLPSNVALCVNKAETYAKALLNGKTYILAAALVPGALGEEAQILETFPGEALVGRKYEPLFDFTAPAASSQDGWRIVEDNYVTLTDGTGIVHIAPAFGEDDSRVGKRFALPFVQLVDSRGLMTGGTRWDGVFVKDADAKIIEELGQNGKLFSTAPYEHSYPFCWRCNTPLIYYARSSWFIKMTEVRDRLVRNTKSVNWLPEHIREGRMGNFVENVIDWSISRERYWGTPLPVWVCAICGKTHTIGSRRELRAMGKNVPENIELHKPFIDAVHLTCPHCGGDMERVSEVIDCWFDSGSMPFAQWHYPFENAEEFERRFPANFISEAIDQTRGWFYTLLAISTLLFDKASFENCIVLGHVQDENGKKMSKHLGNVVDPWSVLDKQGADVVRWYFFTGSMPWLPSRFGEGNLAEAQRKFMGTLWNTYAFYILYADIDGFDPTKHTLVRENLSHMDRWVLSRLNSLVAMVDKSLEELRITEAGREIQAFVDQLSNWYVRRCRERYWGSEMTPDKEAAYMTLYTVLETLSRLLAPFVPFMTECIYQNLVRTVDDTAPISVHLCDFPLCDGSFIESSMERSMDAVLTMVTLGRACRNGAALKNRQPLECMYVVGSAVEGEYADIVAQELNVKRVVFTKDAKAFTTYIIKPQLRTMGPKYGKLLGQINQYLKTVDGNAVMDAFEAGKPYEFVLEGTPVSMNREDALTELTQKPGFVAQAEGPVTVVLDTNLTPELIDEGFVRELTSKLQTMRKEAGFEVTDRITVMVSGNERLSALFDRFSAQIMEDTLCAHRADTAGYSKEWNLNGEEVTLGVTRV